jgi:hypothetical protein
MTLYCSNHPETPAKLRVDVTNQPVCQQCWKEKNYYDPYLARKVFITIRLFGYSVCERGDLHVLVKGEPLRLKKVEWDNIDWSRFSTLFEPGPLATVGKLVQHKIPFSRRYNPNKADTDQVWMCKVGDDFTAAVVYSDSEEKALVNAVYSFLKGNNYER